MVIDVSFGNQKHKIKPITKLSSKREKQNINYLFFWLGGFLTMAAPTKKGVLFLVWQS